LKQIDWYFDFISPFAYLASESLWRFPPQIELRPRPVLFAAILNHWQTLGPAEIPPMRRFTFRHIRWLADSNEIALTLPPAHPFNPLKLLRLSVALGNEIEAVQRLFRFVWAEGCSADDPGQWQRLLEELGMQDAEEQLAADKVKNQLRENRACSGFPLSCWMARFSGASTRSISCSPASRIQNCSSHRKCWPRTTCPRDCSVSGDCGRTGS
jgi:2-hydroxychromene-2-carboxylate isomerase